MLGLAVMLVAGTLGRVPAGAAEPTCFGRTATIQGVPPATPVEVYTEFTGTPGPDVIIGTDGYDLIRAGGGNDLVCTRGGPWDIIHAGDGNDRVRGEGGDDDFENTSGGRDVFWGGGGRDVAWGWPEGTPSTVDPGTTWSIATAR